MAWQHPPPSPAAFEQSVSKTGPNISKLSLFLWTCDLWTCDPSHFHLNAIKFQGGARMIPNINPWAPFSALSNILEAGIASAINTPL